MALNIEKAINMLAANPADTKKNVQEISNEFRILMSEYRDFELNIDNESNMEFITRVEKYAEKQQLLMTILKTIIRTHITNE
jgi:hypothetical protein